MGRIERVEQISHGTWDMSVYAPQNASNSLAGQFVHVRVGHDFVPFLRRPLSVGPCTESSLRLIFTVRGSGTELLTRKTPGDLLDIIGPLGKSFDHPPDSSMAILVAGGIGTVPLLLLDDQFPANVSKLFLTGLRTGSMQTVTTDEAGRRNIITATDDGSVGFHGTVIDLLERKLDELAGTAIMVYGCGPTVMLEALKKVCGDRNIPAQVSLEVPMGCGVGACQSCAVPRADGQGYFLVCQDGPVFDASVVNLTPGVVV